MKPLDGKGALGTGVSPIHLEFIQNQAELSDGAGLEDVEAFHKAVFLNHHARDLEQFRQQSAVHENRLAHLERRLKDTHARLAHLDKLVPVQLDGKSDVRPTQPWTLWDRVMFVAALFGIVGLLAFGVLNVSFNLLESGFVTFLEHPVRAYFWAALLPAGALAVKIGWDLLACPKRRRVYMWTCLALGVAGVIAWVAAYASVYPTLSKTTEEQVASLSVFSEEDNVDTLSGLAPGAAKRIDMIIVSSQAIAEIFLSALLGIYMTILYLRHRPVRLAGNPLFTQIDEERRSLEEAVAKERAALANVRGKESGLTHQLAAFVSLAKSMFRKELASRRGESHQQRALLDQIAKQLRQQLSAVDNGSPAEPEIDDRPLNLPQPSRP
jgi:hypothetical protein